MRFTSTTTPSSMPLRACAYASVPLPAAASRRPNVGIWALGELPSDPSRPREIALCSKKALEAASGVEPLMEVLQTAVCRDGQCWPVRDGAAQGEVVAGSGAAACSAVMGRGEASRRRLGGRLSLTARRVGRLRRSPKYLHSTSARSPTPPSWPRMSTTTSCSTTRSGHTSRLGSSRRAPACGDTDTSDRGLQSP